MDKAGSYSETTGGQGGGGYNQEDKYEKEKKVSREKKKGPDIYHYSIQDLVIICFLRPHYNVRKGNFHLQNFMKEMDIMKKLHHPNLVKMYGICVDKLPFYIILVD